MRKIRFRSLGGQPDVDNSDTRLGFTDGEVKPVTDEQAAILLTNANFVDADTGRNPNFTCASCGAETFAHATYQPQLATRDRGPLQPLVIDGKRYCLDCYDAGKHLPAPTPAPAASTPQPFRVATEE